MDGRASEYLISPNDFRRKNHFIAYGPTSTKPSNSISSFSFEARASPPKVISRYGSCPQSNEPPFLPLFDRQDCHEWTIRVKTRTKLEHLFDPKLLHVG